MKRVANYELCFGKCHDSIIGQTQAMRSELGQASGQDALPGIRHKSWHQVWDCAYEHLASESNPLETLVLDLENSVVIASFSHLNWQITLVSDEECTGIDGDGDDDDDDAPRFGSPCWESEKIGSIGNRELFLNRNASDYHWLLLDGARHEVPFRLGFLERVLERRPNGPLAYGLEFALELRDRILSSHAY